MQCRINPWGALCHHEMGALLTPSPRLPFPTPFHSRPLEVGPLKYSKGVWGSAVRSPSGGLGRKSILMHVTLKI